MTKVEQIRARLKAATPGKWVADCSSHDSAYLTTPDGMLIEFVAPADRTTDRYRRVYANAELCAHAPSDLAYLLRLVEAGQRLNETLHWLAQTVHQNHHDHDDGLFDTCRKNTCQAATKALTVYAAVREGTANAPASA